MSQIMNILSTAVSVYSIVIIVRIILTWFSGNISAPGILCKVTDPYLNWFRRLTFLRIGNMDLSPIAALAVLTVISQIFSFLAQTGMITLGIILALVLRVVWSVVSFFIIFVGIILILRLIAYLTSQNTYGTFWRTIDNISQPILYRINRILFGSKIVNYLTGILVSIGAMVALYVILSLAVSLLFGILARLPV